MGVLFICQKFAVKLIRCRNPQRRSASQRFGRPYVFLFTVYSDAGTRK